MRAPIWHVAGIAGLCVLACSPLQPAELPGAAVGEIGVSPSGSLTYAVPVAVSVGTTGLQPKLTLQHDSLAGNGPAGMGWSIGELAVGGAYGGIRHQVPPPREEFSRIVSYGRSGSGNRAFRVWRKSSDATEAEFAFPDTLVRGRGLRRQSPTSGC